MKRLVFLLLFLATSCNAEESNGHCRHRRSPEPRPRSVSVLEFGAVGNGKTLNTVAFQNAIFYAKSFADKGGAQIYVPAGNWLTGSFNLTSNLTLFLEKGATILGFQDYSHWHVIEPLPSYGSGIESSSWRYRSLISGKNLSDVVITGDNGTINGQGSVWWELFISHSLNYSRPNLVELIGCNDVVVSNLTFLNAPFWNIHPVYCSNVQVQNITAHAPPDSPFTSGVVPDSSKNVCIENSNISMGEDAIVLKSGWDEYGIAYGKPTTNVHIREAKLQSSSGSGLAFGSEMSGGISNILAEHLHIHDSRIGIELKTTRGRGGRMTDILVSDVEMENNLLAFKVSGNCGSHPDDKYDPQALPVVTGITFKNMLGTNVTLAGNFTGISDAPFTSICLSNITLSTTSNLSPSWVCSSLMGSSKDVYPEPCPNLQFPSLGCFSLWYPTSRAMVL